MLGIAHYKARMGRIHGRVGDGANSWTRQISSRAHLPASRRRGGESICSAICGNSPFLWMVVPKRPRNAQGAIGAKGRGQVSHFPSNVCRRAHAEGQVGAAALGNLRWPTYCSAWWILTDGTSPSRMCSRSRGLMRRGSASVRGRPPRLNASSTNWEQKN